MPDGVVRAQQAVVVGDGGEVFVELHAVVHHGAYLQEAELAGAVGMEVDGKLYLDGAFHLLLSVLQDLLHQLGQGEDAVLQDARKGDDLAVAPFVEAIVDALVHGVVGGAYPLERAVLLRLADGHLDEVEAIVDAHGSCFLRAFGRERQEVCLCVAECNLHLAHLQDLMRMGGADAQARSAVHDVFAQAHCQRDGPFLGFLVADGVVVDAACHAADDGVEPAVVLLADYFLQDDGHLLLVDDVARGRHVVLAAAVEDAGVDGLDGFGEHREAFVVVVCRGYHVGAVDAGEGLVVGVLEQAAGADGDGSVHDVEEGLQVADEPHGEACVEEVGEDVLVGDVAERKLVEVVGVHELVEDVGAEHDGLGDADGDAFLFVEVGVASEQMVDEGEAATFPSEAALADAGEVAVLVEALALEDCHDALVLHPAVGDDGVEDDGAVGVDVLQAVPGDALQEFGDGEEGTRGEPAADVVVRDVVEQAARGQRHDVVLQVLQVVQACHLLHRVGVAEDEVAEAEVVAQVVAQVDVDLLGVLVDEAGVTFLCQACLVRLAGVEDEGDVGVAGPYGAEQLEAGLLVLLSAGHHGEAAVADDAQRVVGEAVVEQPCLLVVAGQDYLGPPSHAQHLEACVEGLGGELQALLQHELVERGQDAGVEAYAVLHDEQHLHAGRPYVVLQVHAVLHQLDDGEQQFRVAEPAEDVLEDAQVLVLHAACDAVAEGREHHDGHGGVVELDVAGDVEDAVVLGGRHADDEVYLSAGHRLLGFLAAVHLQEAWREAQSQLGVFREDFLIHAPVVLEHEGVVGIGDEQDVVDAVEHQVDEGGVFQSHLVNLLFDNLQFTIYYLTIYNLLSDDCRFAI